jgi:CRISPR-associated exonuclease Cas4
MIRKTEDALNSVFILPSGKKITGTLVWYYFICKREVWLMGHEITPDENHHALEFGRAVHEIFYKKFMKEVSIEGMKIDLMKRKEKIVCEVKTSSRFVEAASYQLLYYLYRLREEFGENFYGWVLIPEERKRKRVMLDKRAEEEMIKVLKDIKEIVSSELPPPPIRNKFCRRCAYREFCWV